MDTLLKSGRLRVGVTPNKIFEIDYPLLFYTFLICLYSYMENEKPPLSQGLS